jgi:hypothetical protein
MKFATVVLLVLSSLEASNAFIQSQPTFLRSLELCASSDGSNLPKQSRFEGNQREPTAQELEIMDEMITKLSNAKPYDLPNAVRRAFRVVSSPRFFMRIVERTDLTNDEMEKEKLGALASNLVATLEAVVETTEETLDERAKAIQKILKAAAEPETGEFLVPLLPSQMEGMRKIVEGIEPSILDEGFLSTVDTWMNKSHQDGMDGMVGILQKVLQMYSGVQILRAREQLDSNAESTPASELFQKLLSVDPDQWDVQIRNGLKDVKASSLISEIQRTMEAVVLGLENGSMAQRVQAEYLRELVTKANQKTQ